MRTFVIGTVAGIAAIGGVAVAAGAASAQEEPGPDPSGWRAEFVCSHLDQVQGLQADHAMLIADRLALLGETRAAAEAAGDTEAVERIDERTARVTERQGKVGERQERLVTFAAENCG